MTIIFWVLLIAFVVPCYIFGFKKIAGNAQSKADFIRWGYPVLFMRLLGLAEALAATAMLFAPSRLAGIICFAVIFAGAVYTHLRSKDPVKQVMAPVFVFIHLAVVFALSSWVS